MNGLVHKIIYKLLLINSSICISIALTFEAFDFAHAVISTNTHCNNNVPQIKYMEIFQLKKMYSTIQT